MDAGCNKKEEEEKRSEELRQNFELGNARKAEHEGAPNKKPNGALPVTLEELRKETGGEEN